MKYHHIGIPTKKSIKGEYYLSDYKVYGYGYDKSEYGIEWMRFGEGCTLNELIKTVPHIAFEVDDVYKAIKGEKVIVPPDKPGKGLITATIEVNGAPVEFLTDLIAQKARKKFSTTYNSNLDDREIERLLQLESPTDRDGIPKILHDGYNLKRKGLKYNHFGIPTKTPKEGEVYLKDLHIYVTDHTNNPYGIQWMRYEPECKLPQMVKELPHLAFEVDDIEQEIKGKEILIEPNSPYNGMVVAFIVENGAPVEFIQFTETKGKLSEYPC